MTFQDSTSSERSLSVSAPK